MFTSSPLYTVLSSTY